MLNFDLNFIKNVIITLLTLSISKKGIIAILGVSWILLKKGINNAYTHIAFAEPPEFKGADKNGDGGVDAAEFKTLDLDKDFAKLDENGDGKLNKSEYEVALEEECD
jgi:hypothetical protein